MNLLACFILLLAAVGPFIGGWVASRLAESLARRDRTRGLCLACGYDRVGLNELELCPECGHSSASARSVLERHDRACVALPVAAGVAVCVLFVIVGQPMSYGVAAWGCAGVLLPLMVLAHITWLPRFGRRSRVRWTILGVTLAAILALVVPAYFDMAMDRSPGPYGREFGLQIVPLMVGVFSLLIAGWGTAICAAIAAASMKVSLKRPDIGPPSADFTDSARSLW